MKVGYNLSPAAPFEATLIQEIKKKIVQLIKSTTEGIDYRYE